jgi:hypothetical protein
MKTKFAVISLALVVAASAATPALAKSKKHHRVPYAPYAAPYAYAPYPSAPFVTRNVADPSFGNRAGINYAYRTGRCVADLGYGRYEYCGW